MSDTHNAILDYADSYRQMERTGTKSVDIWSVITDIERNMSPHLTEAQSRLAALREELSQRDSFESLYNTAIDERDVLREELADRTNTIFAIRKKCRELVAADTEQSDIWFTARAIDLLIHSDFPDKKFTTLADIEVERLQQRLADAERRNAECMALLAETSKAILRHQAEQPMSNRLAGLLTKARAKVDRYLKAVLNPNPEAASQVGHCTFEEPCKCKTDKEKIWCGAWVEDETNE